MYVNLSEHIPTIPHWFHVPFFANVRSIWHCVGGNRFGSSLTCVLFQLQIIFSLVKQQATTGITSLVNWLRSSTVCCRRSSKDLHCLLWSSGMTMLTNHSKFPPIADGEFLAGTRVLAALNKIGSWYLQRKFHGDVRRFLEEFTTSVLSTVAARSKIGQGLSCFCPAILIGGDDHAPLHLLGLLLDGLLDRGWVKGSGIEACRSEY